MSYDPSILAAVIITFSVFGALFLGYYRGYRRGRMDGYNDGYITATETKQFHERHSTDAI